MAGREPTDATGRSTTRQPGGEELGRFCGRILSEFIADPARNNMGPGRSDPAWEDFLLGFAAGDDPLWDQLKDVAGPQHWTPAEAFAAAAGSGEAAAVPGGTPALVTRGREPAAAGNVAARGAAPQVPATGAGRAAAEAGDTTAPARPSELTVISWALCQTEAAKAANRLEKRMPSEPWARSRIYGQQANVALHLVMVDALHKEGYEAVPPSLLPTWTEAEAHSNNWRSTWSERHVAYVCGLGTFGLSGGLITRKGQAVRLGSVVVKAVIPVTPRAYDSPFAYCLFYSGYGCTECAERCPTGSVSPGGRDKEACAYHLIPRSREHVTRVYGFDGYACGLCQTGVPCESGIPEGLAPREKGG